MKLFRWLRVLEYTGSLEAVQAAVAQRSVKGQSPPDWRGADGSGPRLVIRESFVGEVPELLPCEHNRTGAEAPDWVRKCNDCGAIMPEPETKVCPHLEAKMVECYADHDRYRCEQCGMFVQKGWVPELYNRFRERAMAWPE